MPSSRTVTGVQPEQVISSRLRGRSLAVALLLGTALWAQTPQQAPKAASSDSSQPISFAEQILPLLQDKCLLCHSGGNSATTLDLSTREGLLRGGKRGPAVIPGDPQSSLLYKVVGHEAEPFMPMGGQQLPPEAITRIADWIAAGALYEESAPGQSAGIDSKTVASGGAGQDTVFAKHIRPLLENVCLNCHSGEDKASGLDLSTRDSLLRGGDRGPAIVVSDPRSSLLYNLVAHEAEPHMPFMADQLPEETINYLAEWIKEGAPYGGTVKAAKSSLPGSDHWAYQTVARPPVPTVKNREWVRNPIDAFVAAEHETRGLTPLPPAGKRVLLRRVYLDLIGLPPTPEEIRAFLADDSNGAYEKVVDRLLASRQYGERWGRHWMDIWRYSDWYGFQKQKEVRNSQRHIWRWRDWIIESLNEDKGYDRMITEMLAGDELAPTDPEVLRATGYLARSWYKFNRTVWLQDTAEYVATSFLGTTMKCARCHDHKYDPILQTEYYRFRAFFEPHGIRVDRVPGEPDLEADGLARAFDAEPGAPTYRFLQGDEGKPDKEHPLTPGVPRILGGDGLDFREADLPIEAYYPDLRAPVRDDLLSQARATIEKAESDLIEAKRSLVDARRRVVDPPRTADVLTREVNPPADADVSESADAVMSEEEALAAFDKAKVAVTIAERKLRTAQAELPALEARMAADVAAYGIEPAANAEELAEQAQKLERTARLVAAQADLLQAEQELAEALNPPRPADDDSPKGEKAAVADEMKVKLAQKKLQAALDALGKATEGYTPVGESYPKSSTGRRLALARWIASRKNPLTARVAINHTWARHFGEPLVSTVFNFGLSGKPSTHPKLLDWLAAELMEKNWSMKTIHRLIATSNTYRMQSSVELSHRNHAIDKDNVYLWRRKPARMEAELVRDSILHLAGQLDTTMGGPEIEVTEQEESRRRSLYFYHSPDAQLLILKLFDAADPNECFRRNASITPHQALALSNSKLSHAMSRLLARRLTQEVGDTKNSNLRFIDRAFETVLSRPPSAKERAESQKFLVEQSKLYRESRELKPFENGPENSVGPSEDPSLRSRESLAHVLFNHDEFVTIR